MLSLRTTASPGHVPDGSPDLIAAFTSNGKASKVDVYQEITIDQRVDVLPDGSASIRRVISSYNNTPDTLDTESRQGYDTAWSKDGWYIYVPDAAVNARITKLTGFDEVNEPATYDDSLGRTFIAVFGWTAPQGTSRITVEYGMPPGSFGKDPTALRYGADAAVQPLVNPTQLRLTVQFPKDTKPIAASARPQDDWVERGRRAQLEHTIVESLGLGISAEAAN